MTNHYSQASCIMRFTRLFATLCVALFTLTACLEDHLPDIPKAEHRLTIAAAKTFFEASVATTRTTFADDPGITPGEFAPKWEQAKYTADTLIESVDVPIITGCSYRMTFTIRNEESGKRSTYSLPIYQKLIVVRNSRSDEMECFIMNLIPDKEYLIKNRSALLKKVFNGNFADYSGIVLYSQLKGNRTVRVDRYYAGRKIQTASVFDEALSLEQVQNRMQTLIQNASAKKTIRAVTRSESGGGFEGGTVPPVIVGPDPEIPPVDPNPGEITPPVNPNPGGGGGGGSGSSEKPNISSLTQKLFNFTNSNLTKEQTEKLDLIINKLAQNKVATFLCESLKAQVKIQYKPDLPSIVNGRYSAKDGTIYIKNFDGTGINRTLFEELTHALQDQFYPEGIIKYGHNNSGYNPPGHCNVEFEAHMIKALYDVTNNADVLDFGSSRCKYGIYGDLDFMIEFGNRAGDYIEFGGIKYNGEYFQSEYLSDFSRGDPHYASDSLPEVFKMQLFDLFLKGVSMK